MSDEELRKAIIGIVEAEYKSPKDMMTKQGGATLVATMTEKYGSYEAYKQAMRELGSRGGSVKGTKGFAADSVKARIAGSIGGRYGRRGYKLIERTETSGTYRRMSDGAIVEFKY